MNLFKNYSNEKLMQLYEDLEYTLEYESDTLSKYEIQVYRNQMKQISDEVNRRYRERNTPRTIDDIERDELA